MKSKSSNNIHLKLGQHVERLELLEVKDLGVRKPELLDETHINLLLEKCLLFLVKFKVCNPRESTRARLPALPLVPGSRRF